ncbi:conserved hypothetical protein [Uncinocarpus reesii 1704]|uniref:Monooxygenase n=1 Tax=Uncinocarpus reesii (strain UAMH 1704) TaxID=336963 RepID=C4JXK5_UNCRE|nr:uncharacterized protein UREG_06378 [Uncinocarpus reesii 1704]EEP81513.1 conserved hypothetical protein [Uncinocarpus reesii 1704]
MAPNNYSQTSVGNKEYTKAAIVVIGAGISDSLKGSAPPSTSSRIISIISSSLRKVLGSAEHGEIINTRAVAAMNYLRMVAAKYNLYQYIRFSSEVQESRWDDVKNEWCTKVKVIGSKDVEFGEEYCITSDFLVSGVGQLNYPKYPSIPGIDSFKGKMMHSARWDWTYDYKGKRIGIIGNGATAAQIIPEVAGDASHLTIFQRTANWVVPRMDLAVWKPFRTIFRYCPPVQWRLRASIMDFREAVHAVMRDPKSSTADFMRKASLHMMHKALPDNPNLWEKLTPDYPPGCKRLILSDDYFPTLARDNVSLETGHIDRISENGIIVDGVEQELDLIILATGFRTVEFMHPIKIYGRNGKPLSEIWNGGARALYGVAVEDLPNFGMLYGPNTNLGHNSIILMIEAQSRYMLAMIKEVLRARDRGQTLAIAPKPGKVEEFNSNLQETLSSTAFASPNCQSWYKTAEGLITNNWSGTVVDYQKLLSKLDWNDFDLEGSGAERIRSTRVANLGRVREESLLGLKGLTVVSALALAGTLAYKAHHFLPRWR